MNPDNVTYCKGCRRGLFDIVDPEILPKPDLWTELDILPESEVFPKAEPPTRFKNFVKNDAPDTLRKLLLIDLIVCCACIAAASFMAVMAGYYGLADAVAMALTILVMFLVKSRACAVILLVYSVLSSVYGFFIDNSFACFPMVIAGILSTVTFLALNRAYKKYKANTFPMEVI